MKTKAHRGRKEASEANDLDNFPGDEQVDEWVDRVAKKAALKELKSSTRCEVVGSGCPL